MSELLVNANALSIPLADESIDMCVTSPPYYGLRDYGTDAQLGLEESPEQYIENMVAVFREVWRILKPHGTLWLNIGDSYYANRVANGEKGGIGNSSIKGREHHSRAGGAPRKDIKPKDLIGIPWMLAFALRQPHEHSLIKDRIDRAWFAGIMDGEGCITANEVSTSLHDGRATNPSYPIILQVRMADTEALERIVAITNVSKVQAESNPPANLRANQRPASTWKTSGDNAMNLLAEAYPYLTVKRRQALVAWNLQKLKEGIETKRGTPIPRENMDKRKLLYRIIRDLNQRRETDIPSWCKEPSIKTEPGWYLRSDVIWAKPNPMPESVADRPTKSHEYLFLLSKQPKYYYDADAVREDSTSVGSTTRTEPQFHDEIYGDGDDKGARRGRLRPQWVCLWARGRQEKPPLGLDCNHKAIQGSALRHIPARAD